MHVPVKCFSDAIAYLLPYFIIFFITIHYMLSKKTLLVSSKLLLYALIPRKNINKGFNSLSSL